MGVPADLKYTKDHEWVRIEGNCATIGITDYAQQSLGDIVFCELPKVGTAVSAGKTFGVVESVKAVSDLYAPVDGKVIAINQAVIDNPASLNTAAFGAAWLLQVDISAGADLSALLDAAAYDTLISDE